MVIAAVCFVAVGCKGGDNDDDDDDDVGDWTTLNVGGGVTITGVKVVDQNPSKISFTKLTDGIKVKGGNYDWCYPVFTVDLGGSKKLSQFTNVKFTIKTIGGDTSYKSVALLASDTDFTGQMSEYNSGTYSQAARVVWFENGNALAASPQTKTFTATTTGADTAASGTGTIYMVIMLGNNGTGTEYDITDITFTP